MLPFGDKGKLWSLLLSKALLKFFHFKFKELQPDFQDESSGLCQNFLFTGDLVEALTGMFTLKFDLERDRDFQWEYLQKVLSQDNFSKNNFKVVLLKTRNKNCKRVPKKRLQSVLQTSS